MTHSNVVNLVPEPSDQFKINVGKEVTKDGVNCNEVSFIPNNCSNYFSSVIGKSGVGKTFLIRKLLNQYQQSGSITSIVIDTQGDFSASNFESYLPGSSHNLHHLAFDYIKSPVTINPFKITVTGSNSDYMFASKNVKEAIKCFNPSLGSQQESLLNLIIDMAYKQAGIIADNPDTWIMDPPKLDKVLEIASSMLAEAETGLSSGIMGRISRAVSSLHKLNTKIDRGGKPNKLKELYDDAESSKEQLKESICELIDSEDPSLFVTGKHSVDRLHSVCNTLQDMVNSGLFGSDSLSLKPNKINVIDISELHPDLFPTIIHLLLYRTFQTAALRKKKSGRIGNRLSTLLVFDEGKIFSDSSSRTMSPLTRIIEEGRKYELGGIFGLQNSRQIPPKFLSNIATTFLLPVASNDIVSTANTYGIDKEMLRYLTPKKEALFSSDSPEHIKIET